ncbi:formate dehydrogenase subunit gamma [Entomobacter blattae]|uniref:Prokaryotic cytochrome b561 n=1 Tax=Entomobacter blattae TaxID=2762277 RepID=A0A7H1NT27_9PROT|nr:formate dehydrogenase subunit gamma [Entomobacter blattae]QNT78937.1 Prokaryotic cytochrome b561 [Entomobacter blattae]
MSNPPVKQRSFKALLAFLLFCLVFPSAVGVAQTIPQNLPNTPAHVLEQKLDTTVLPPTTRGFVHIPDQKAAVLVQPPGKIFRFFHKYIQFWVDILAILGTLIAIAGLYWLAGPMDYTPDARNRRLLRFKFIERLGHWITAISFVLLAVTGLNMVLGRWLLMPLMGDNSFSAFSAWGKTIHNFVGFPFILGLAIILIAFFRYNIPRKIDLQWMKQMGGMFNKKHVPADKFNAGQKMIYWIAAFFGSALVLSGLCLLIPFALFGILGMQITLVFHSCVAIFMIVVILGHAYLGVWGVKGSFPAMTNGTVDLNWALTHHEIWAKKEESAHPQNLS